MKKSRILVAPLNWGLGHATRCIPIIRELEKSGLEPVLGSDGDALKLLKKEFPHLIALELPSYNITYTKKGEFLKWKLLLGTTKILDAIRKEKRLTKKIVKEYDICGIISDNRFGVRSRSTKNVFITHQLTVLSGATTFLSSSLHREYIKKFDQCWVPDIEGFQNLSGILGHPSVKPQNIKYIGTLSRFEKRDIPRVYNYLFLLSGPEPQRFILENILLEKLKSSDKKILFIRGVLNDENLENHNPNIHIKNYLYGKLLQEAINCSEVVISRSGYSSIMDFAKLQKKTFFIPTPGQAEQEYLATRFEELQMAPYCKQDNFEVSQLERIADYKGLGNFCNGRLRDLFAFFHGE